MTQSVSKVPTWLAWLARGAYTTAWVLALPIALLYLLWRSRLQPEYRAHLAERFGWFGYRPGSDKPLIWVHAVSVGETRAAEPLIKALLERWPEYGLLLTHMTPTGRATGQSLYIDAMPGRTIVQVYLPYDLPWFTTAFLRRYDPVVGVMMETELWPNLVASAQAKQTPLVIANARLSDKSFARGHRFKALLAPALQGVSLVLAQTDADAGRIRQLASVNTLVVGNLKFDVQPDADLLALGRLWRQRVGRQVVLFASSRDGEEPAVLSAWQALDRDDLLLVIVPRHPQRFAEVRKLMSNTALPMGDRKALEETDVGAWQSNPPRLLLGDSMGEMPAWYAMADVVLMGGSFEPHGGQNLIEACACGVPVIIGQSTFNFAQAAEQALEINAAIRVPDANTAVREALSLIDDPERLQKMAEQAVIFSNAPRGATALSVENISAVLQW